MNLCILTVDGKQKCEVCDEKWQTRKEKHSTGSKEIPLLSTMSLLTLDGSHVSINICNLHSKNIQAFVKANPKSLTVKNLVTMKTRIFRKLRK